MTANQILSVIQKNSHQMSSDIDDYYAFLKHRPICLEIISAVKFISPRVLKAVLFLAL